MKKHYPRYKEYFKNAYHHIYNRGVNKERIFLDQQDYITFLKRLRHYKNKYQISILSYCLMPNHFHLETQQLGDKSLSTMVQYLTNGYAMYFNHKYKHSGHLFEGKFKAILIPEERLLFISRYTHLNPLVAKLVDNLKNWQWSSYLDFINQRNGTLPNKEKVLCRMSAVDYKKFIEEDIEKSIMAKKYKQMLKLLEKYE